MSKLREALKKTWLRPVVLKLRSKEKAFRRWHLLRVALPKIYDSHRNEPFDENKVIFIELYADGISNSFACLYDKLQQETDFDLHVHCLRSTFVNRRQYVKNCKALFHDMATARYIFINNNINIMGCFKRREGQKVVQTWHACGAFKRFGMSTGDLIFGASTKNQKKYPVNTNYTRVTVSSPEVVWAYVEAMDMGDRADLVQPLGVSRTDIFFEKDTIDAAYEHVYEKFPAARGKKIILFAPTFRGRVKSAETALAFDPEPFYQAFRDDYVLIVKHHPLVREIPALPAHMKNSFAYDATKTLSIEDLLCVSDICISDYSSLIFEYSLFNRPMLFFAYDKDEYDDWRGFYYPYEELTPGPVFTRNEEMVDYILHIDERFDPQVVADFREKFMSACDGHATERILLDTMGEEVLARHRKSQQ